jgi:hypothetical protein
MRVSEVSEARHTPRFIERKQMRLEVLHKCAAKRRFHPDQRITVPMPFEQRDLG